MYVVCIFAALTVATANAGLIGAPLATSIVGTRTISVAAPYASIGLETPLIGKTLVAGPAVAPLGLGLGEPLLGKSILAPSIAPLGLGAPLLGKSILAPSIAPLGLGAPLLGKSILAAPAISTVALAGPGLAGPVLKAW